MVSSVSRAENSGCVRRMKSRRAGKPVFLPILTATLLTTSFVHAPAALAQQQSRADSGPALEEIVVTARKREENLQDTPVSVSAFSGAALAERQVVNVADVGNFTPNLIIDSASALGGSSSTISAFIRGVGQSDFNLTIDPGVGLYLDGVYISRSVGSLLDTVDLERVEVLRGPQGTLFGKNTIGGAIVLTSRQPDDEFAGQLEAVTGSYGRHDLRAALNVPLGDRLAMRVTGSTQNRNGYYRRLQDGDRMGNRSSVSGRFQLAWEATDTLTVSLSLDGTRVREEGKPLTLIAVNPVADFAGFWNFAVNGATCFTPPSGLPVPNHPACYNSQWITANRRATNTTGANFSNLDLWGSSLTVDWQLGQVNFKSITAYRDLESAFFQDYDGSPLPIGETGNDYSQTQFSQEFQFSGTALDDRLKWLLGLYYLNEKGKDINSLTFSVADFISGGKVRNDSYAAFTQLGFAITDRLNLTLGARYTRETKRFTPDQFIVIDRTGGTILALSQLFIPVGNPNGNLILPTAQASIKDNEFTPAISLDYQVNEDVLVYASYSKGFKSGGFTQRVFPPEAVVPDFGPERVTAYEAGVKSELFDRRLRLNLAAFQSDYNGLQIIVNEGVAPKVRNAGKARIRGFELEAEAVLSEAVRMSAGVGYTDAEYLRVNPTAVGITAANKFGNVPAWTATAGVSADLFRIGEGQISSRVDWSYRSSHFKDAINTPEIRQSAYSLVNASLSYRSEDDGWGLTAGVTNLFDKDYLVSGYNDLTTIGVVTGTFARPREWFINASIGF